MTWHMVEQYGQPSPAQWMVDLLAEIAIGLRELTESPEHSEIQKTDLAIAHLSRVATLTYLLRSGWSGPVYRVFRDRLLERLNDFDRVRAARVIEATLGENAPEEWQLGCALPPASDWLGQALPTLLGSLCAPADPVVAERLATLARHCLETRPWLTANGPAPSGARLAKLLRLGRRLRVALELFHPGLSDEWRAARPALVAWVESLERWAQVRRVARALRRGGSRASRARLRRTERRQAAQSLAATSALQSQLQIPLEIDWFQVVQERTSACTRIEIRKSDV